ncbi:MAG: hypothetical protein HYX35_01420, partial [Proteobacteria bacterium]|nr:hypothetical protein [Pseudomonadota bacterium]
MKNSIFTLLVTAAVLAATPVLAMDPNQEVPAISVKGRPVIDKSARDLKGVVDDLETNGSILAMMSTGKKGRFSYDEKKNYKLDQMVGALRDSNFLTWGPVTYGDDRIEFAISLTTPTQKNKTGALSPIVFERDGIVGDTPPSSPKASKKSPKHSPVSSPESSDDEGTTAPSKAITMKNPNFLEDWLEFGLIKTDPIAVKEGQTLTVT